MKRKQLHPVKKILPRIIQPTALTVSSASRTSSAIVTSEVDSSTASPKTQLCNSDAKQKVSTSLNNVKIDRCSSSVSPKVRADEVNSKWQHSDPNNQGDVLQTPHILNVFSVSSEKSCSGEPNINLRHSLSSKIKPSHESQIQLSDDVYSNPTSSIGSFPLTQKQTLVGVKPRRLPMSPLTIPTTDENDQRDSSTQTSVPANSEMENCVVSESMLTVDSQNSASSDSSSSFSRNQVLSSTFMASTKTSAYKEAKSSQDGLPEVITIDDDDPIEIIDVDAEPENQLQNEQGVLTVDECPSTSSTCETNQQCGNNVTNVAAAANVTYVPICIPIYTLPWNVLPANVLETLKTEYEKSRTLNIIQEVREQFEAEEQNKKLMEALESSEKDTDKNRKKKKTRAHVLSNRHRIIRRICSKSLLEDNRPSQIPTLDRTTESRFNGSKIPQRPRGKSKYNFSYLRRLKIVTRKPGGRIVVNRERFSRLRRRSRVLCKDRISKKKKKTAEGRTTQNMSVIEPQNDIDSDVTTQSTSVTDLKPKDQKMNMSVSTSERKPSATSRFRRFWSIKEK